MKNWKIGLGLGVACAACCAIPLLGAAGGLAALGTAIWACADELGLIVLAVGVVSAAAFVLWRMHRRRCQPSEAGCDCSSSCSTGSTPASH